MLFVESWTFFISASGSGWVVGGVDPLLAFVEEADATTGFMLFHAELYCCTLSSASRRAGMPLGSTCSKTAAAGLGGVEPEAPIRFLSEKTLTLSSKSSKRPAT